MKFVFQINFFHWTLKAISWQKHHLFGEVTFNDSNEKNLNF